MQREDKLDRMYVLLAILVGALAFVAPNAVSETGVDANYKNVTVSTELNITNSFPEVLDVRIADNHTLRAGRTKQVTCNATVRDFDGIDTVTVNGTLFDQSTTSLTAPDDNNSHYTDPSCALQPGNTSTKGNFTCSFDLEYYANPGTNWNCTVQATDDTNITGSNSNGTAIADLIALNVSKRTIDYGNLEVGQTSAFIPANVTNFGNLNINVTVRGYGVTEGDNLSMDCEFNSIPINQERVSLNTSANFSDMLRLNSTDKFIPNLTILQRQNETVNDRINTTYWKLNVPTSSNPGGTCNGTVVFEARQA